ncbi:hypothetical protein BIV01_03050 [Curtobacterium sp. MCBA15_013]|nr:hypothetical protein BIV01_03050 [Curtobacterium sp. MCBA15_013]
MRAFHAWDESRSEEEFLCDVLKELGSGVWAALDEMFFEMMLSGAEVLSLLKGRELEALVGAGLILREGAEHRWAAPKRIGELKNALGTLVSGAIEAPDGAGDVYRSLWVMERVIRNAVRRRARQAHPQRWRSTLVPEGLAGSILERASIAGYPAAVSINEIRDPLEWLTLGELLTLRESSSIGDLGMPQHLWRLFSGEVSPIRNRLSHMRALKQADFATALKWEKVLLRKVV